MPKLNLNTVFDFDNLQTAQTIGAYKTLLTNNLLSISAGNGNLSFYFPVKKKKKT